jgi:hypothetical protein
MKQVETISMNQTVSQGLSNIISDMDGEKVMLSIENGKYYNLGEIGGEIWDLMQEPNVINRLVKDLQLIYDVDQLNCEEQVISFLSKLKNEGLLHIHS